MDEIINLPLELQAKLMRVMQENDVRPVGSNKTRQVDVRIITAARSSLFKLVGQKQFREDLFYRLYVYPITVSSLADRSEDIPMLANFFLNKFAKKQNKKVERFNADILHYMKLHPWTGNIRELENFIERLVTYVPADQKELDTNTLPDELKNEIKDDVLAKKNTDMNSLNKSMSDYEEKRNGVTELTLLLTGVRYW